MFSLAGKRILLTGASGFVGSHVLDRLVQSSRARRDEIVALDRRQVDLRDYTSCLRAMEGCQVVIHLAADTGGAGYCGLHPATQYLNCSLIDLSVFRAAATLGVERLVVLSSVIAYPERVPVPFREADLFGGAPSATHLGYGLAKRNAVLMTRMFHQEYGLNGSAIVAANAYGPRDHFEPRRSNIIPATIVKCLEESQLVVWGDGKPTRDFIYVTDLAEGILRALESLPPGDYVNLGSGREVSIAQVVQAVVRLSGFQGAVTFDKSKANGDIRRLADTSKAAVLLGFTPGVDLEQGLRATIDWYRSQRTGPAA